MTNKNSPFIPLKKRYYIGKIKYGTPYFMPIFYSNTILKIRKLKLLSKEDYEEAIRNRSWLKDILKFSNLPKSRRSKDWIVNLFGTFFWIEIGFPIMYKNIELGWKDKWNSPRFEWSPMKMLFFFKWQFVIIYEPDCDQSLIGNYWTMYLWWYYYSDKDIDNAEKTWGWVDIETNKSTWDANLTRL